MSKEVAEQLINPEEQEFDKRAVVTELFELKDQIKRIEERDLKGLKERQKTLEAILFAKLEVGEQVAFSGIGSVSIKEEIQPHVVDWEAFYKHVTEEQAFYLMPRKVNGAPFRDALNAGMDIPGLSPVTVRKMSATKRK